MCAFAQDEKCQLQSEMLAVKAAGESSAQPSAATAALDKARCMSACCAAWAGRRAWQGVGAIAQLGSWPQENTLFTLRCAWGLWLPQELQESRQHVENLLQQVQTQERRVADLEAEQVGGGAG